MFDPASIVIAPAKESGVLATLRRARALIEQPERWAQNVLAQSAQGKKIRYRFLPSTEAVGFCAVGAIYQTTSDQTLRRDAWMLLERVMGMPIDCYNDARGRSHSEILGAFDRAIALSAQSKTYD